MQLLPTTKNEILNVCLILILTVATVLRVVDLESTPEGLHADEASYLLNTVSLIESARDEDGRFLPLSLQSLTDPKPALYSYLQAPFVMILGPTTTASRLPSVILGVVSLFVLYTLFSSAGQRKLGLLLISVLAISPWHIVASRSTQEVIFSFVFFVLSFFFILSFIQHSKWRSFILLCVFACLSMYMYHAAKIVLPLFTILYSLILVLQRQIIWKKALQIALGISCALIISLLLQNSSIRLQTISILKSPLPYSYILEQTYAATPLAPQSILRFFYNKPHFYGREIIIQYASYFSPLFLFFEWSEPRRYVVPFHGLLYVIEIPLLLLGLFAVSKRPTRLSLPMFLLLVLAPLPAIATSQEVPSTIRSFALVLPLAYFIASGLREILRVPMRNLRYVLLSLILFGYSLSVLYFLMQYFVQQKVYQPWYRNLPYQRISEKMLLYQSNYERIVITSDLRPLYAYFALDGILSLEQLRSIPAARFQNEYRIDKYIFSQSHCRRDADWSADTLYILEIGCLAELQPVNFRTIETIEYGDGTPVYIFATYEQ